MKAILENELFIHCASQLFGSEKSHAASEFTRRFSQSQKNEICSAIATVLTDEVDTGRVSVTAQKLPEGEEHGFKSILWKHKREGVTQEIALFRIKDTLTENWLPVLGIAVAVFTSPIGAAFSAAELARRIWRNFRKLKRPQDADAIEVLEAIVKCRAKAVTASDALEPTTRDIAATAGRISEGDVHAALKKLIGLQAVEVAEWGAQAGDLRHPENRWKIRF